MKQGLILLSLVAIFLMTPGSCNDKKREHKREIKKYCIYLATRKIYSSSHISTPNPPAVVTGDLQVSYTIYADCAHECDMSVYYSTGGGYYPATIDNASVGSIWQNTIENISVPSINPETGVGNAATYTFVWDSVSDVGYEYVQGVTLNMVIEEPDSLYTHPYVYWGDSVWTKPFTVDNNRKPSVQVITPGPSVSGDAMVEFTLTDLDDDICKVTVEYSKDNGSNYFAATLRDVTSYPVSANIIFGIDHTATPKQYVFVWDTANDMPLKYNEQMKIKLTANDGLVNSDPSESGTFTVENNYAPVTTIEDPDGTQTGDVRLDFGVADVDSSAATVTFNYSIDGGVTWQPASIKYSSIGTLDNDAITVTGTSATPITGYCVWNSLGDGIATENLETNVRIAVSAADDQRQGPAATTRSFVVDNTLAGGWGDAEVISGTNAASAPDCAISPTSENPYVVWAGPDCSSISQIYLTSHNGISWAAPAIVTSSATGATAPRVAVTADEYVHLVYVEDYAVYYTYYNTAVWSAPVKLSGIGIAGEPDISGDTNNDAQVVWKEFTSGRYEIYYCVVSGGAPGATELVSDTTEDSESPSIACNGVAPYVAWSDASLGWWEIFAASGPAVWVPLGCVSDTPGNSRRPSAAVDSSTGDVAVVWMDDTPATNFDIYINTYTGSWGNAVNVSLNSGNSVTPCVSYRSSVPRIVWSDNTNPAQTYEIVYSSFLSGSGTPSIVLSNTTGESNSPALVTAASGKQVLVWQEISVSGNLISARIR
ncbi:MAG: hypothetical protein ACYS8W_18525 [Planctomycetota bacterium]|jgi:hypothetical protein